MKLFAYWNSAGTVIYKTTSTQVYPLDHLGDDDWSWERCPQFDLIFDNQELDDE